MGGHRGGSPDPRGWHLSADGGRLFEQGLSAFSEAEILFSLQGEYTRFEAWVGIDDRVDSKAALKGSVEFTVEGVLQEG